MPSILARQQKSPVTKIQPDSRLREVGIIQILFVDDIAVPVVTNQLPAVILSNRQDPKLELFLTDPLPVDIRDDDRI